MKKLLKIIDLPDIFTFGGATIFTFGLWMIYPPSALMLLGLFLVYLGMFTGGR